jgi:hypothetical protein
MKDSFNKDWITSNSIDVCAQYEKGILTLRALHYQLVGRGMTNDIAHYKRVVSAMIDARWAGQIEFDVFSDLDRSMVGVTHADETLLEDGIDNGKRQVSVWMRFYSKNRWENQPYYPEIFIEKKALQGVFQQTCRAWNLALGACKGYPSLSFLHESSWRFKRAIERGKQPIILYFGDYDPSGEDIPRSIEENLLKLGADVPVRRIALMESQVTAWDLPFAPAKETDSRTAKWDGLGQVELDAVKPEKLMELLTDSIREVYDQNLHDILMDIEKQEGVLYRSALKEYVNSLAD